MQVQSLIIGVGFTALTCSSAASQSCSIGGNTNLYQQSANIVVSSSLQPPQYGLVNDNQFAGRVNTKTFASAQSGFENGIPQTRVNLNAKIGQFQDNHGCQPVGIMGCMLDPISATFLAVYPGSDLLRFGIHPGDGYLSVRGQPVVHSLYWFQDMTRGGLVLM